MTDIEKIFNEIYDATYKKTLVYITVKCSNTHDIEDILQETYTELYSVLRRKGTEYIISPEAFVFKIAKRKIYLHYSLKERLRGISLNTEDESERELIDSLSDDFNIEDELCTKELIEDIGNYIFSKPQIVQKIFMLYYTLDLSIAEIAEQLEVTPSYVKNKLYRTLNEIKKQINIHP